MGLVDHTFYSGNPNWKEETIEYKKPIVKPNKLNRDIIIGFIGGIIFYSILLLIILWI